MRKRISFLFVLFVFVAFVFGCGETNVIKIDVKEKEITLEEGKEAFLDITLTGDATLVITADNDNIEVSEKKIKAVKAGTTIVTISVKEDANIKASIKVTITKALEVETKEYTIKKIIFDKEETLKFTDAKEVSLETLEQEGYIFLGWYEGDKLVEQLENKDYVLEAKFEKIKFQITFQIFENEVMDSEFEYGETDVLYTPEKEGFIFLGWYEDEKLVEKLENRNYYLVAKWEKLIPEYTISYNLNGGSAIGLIEKFKEGEKVELPKAVKDGCDFLGWYEGEEKIETIENRDYNLEARFIEVTPYIEIITPDNKTEFYLDDKVQLIAKVHPESLGEEVIWKADSKTKARGTINEEGKVNIISSGILTFKVQAKSSSKVSAQIDLNVLDSIDPDRLMATINNEFVATQQMRIYDSNEGYQYTLIGNICNYLFQDQKITQNIIPENKANRPGTTANGNRFTCRFVAVHEVGAAGNATSTSSYCVSNNDVSWHFTVGNDGVYQQLPLNEVGYHAGDGTKTPIEYINTGVKAPFGDNSPAKVTINQITGNFEINGEEMDVKAPLRSDGKIVLNSQLPYTGITTYVNANGYYMMANTHWDNTYQTLANYGGNLSSIGIETCVNKGSNIFYTWQRCAKLIGGYILQETGLNLYNVKQHNTFSGKDCPQSIRKADRWPTFMELVTFEYNIQKYFLSKGYTIELICDNPLVSKTGQVNELPEYSTKVEYQVKLTSADGSFDKTYSFVSTIPGKANQ